MPRLDAVDLRLLQPSHLTAFNQLVKLLGILAYAIRTVYSINKSKVHLGFVGHEWEAHTGEWTSSCELRDDTLTRYCTIVAELDAALNSWTDSLPDHRGCTARLPWSSASLTDEFPSKMGSEYPTECTVRASHHAPSNLSLYPNHDTSALHSRQREDVTSVLPLSRHLHQCGPFCKPHSRYSHRTRRRGVSSGVCDCLHRWSHASH